ncbi:MAG: cytochrome c oxidase subunit II [Cytophagales bacterium]|nr:MAG: cytochrome c oxidase subunit II [Cytophagales bacterium]
MLGFIIGVIVALILSVLFMLFRIQTLVSLVKTAKSRVDSFNKLNAALMLIVPVIGFILFIWYSGVASQYYLPEPASEHGKMTDGMFWITIYVITAMFLLTNVLLFFFAFRYQYKEGYKASFFHDNTRLEIVWTIIPAAIMTWLVLYGNYIWWEIMKDPPKDAVVVELMGHQFAWKVRYPGKDNALGKYDFRLTDNVNEMGIDFEDKNANDDFMSGEIHIPVNHPILFKIRARDVLHSVFAPHFRLKMDAVPGMPTQFLFTPTKTTEQMRTELNNPKFNYEIACTEVCGRGHFAMRLIVIVEDEATYKKWYAAQKPFLENNPNYKGKGLNQYLKKNLAESQQNTKEKASLIP